MNILVICREIPPVGGGAGHVAFHLAQELSRLGDHIHIITMHYGRLPAYEERGNITLQRVWCNRKRQDSSYLLEMLLFCFMASHEGLKIAKHHAFDLIHSHSIVPDGLIGYTLSRRLNIPLVVTAHGSDVPGHNPDKFGTAHAIVRPLWHRVMDHAATVVAPSRHFAEKIRKFRPKQEIVLIPNGIVLDTFRPKAKGHSFLIVSRLVRFKNFHIFLKALTYIDSPQTIHIVGIGPMLDELKMLARQISNHTIIFHGWLENGSEQWRSLYEQSRYFVLPSESENFPINLLEAQLAGLIILASALPSIREVTGDEAIFFKSLDAEGIAETINEVLYGQIPGIETLGERARQRVREHFSWKASAVRYRKIYETVVS